MQDLVTCNHCAVFAATVSYGYNLRLCRLRILKYSCQPTYSPLLLPTSPHLPRPVQAQPLSIANPTPHSHTNSKPSTSKLPPTTERDEFLKPQFTTNTTLPLTSVLSLTAFGAFETKCGQEPKIFL